MGYSAKAIANWFLETAEAEGVPVSPLKLQKLVYLAHGWHLGLTDGEPLVDDEFAQAWRYGPVFQSLYDEFSEYGKDPIERLAEEIDFSKSGELKISEPGILSHDRDTHRLLERTWEIYGHRTAAQLSALTHKSGSPWDITREEHEAYRYPDIDNDLITDYYLEKINENKKRRG